MNTGQTKIKINQRTKDLQAPTHKTKRSVNICKYLKLSETSEYVKQTNKRTKHTHESSPGNYFYFLIQPLVNR